MSGKEPWEEELEHLPREIEPARDLWPAIERRITSGSRGAVSRWRTWRVELVAAAAAIVVFLAGWGVARLSSIAPVAPVATETADHRTLDAQYATAAQQLLDTLDQGGIAPETAAQIRRDFAAMDDAVHGIRAALDEQPRDQRLERQLATEVRRRNHVLQRIAEIQIAGLHLGGNE